jgi:hypothetical protein
MTGLVSPSSCSSLSIVVAAERAVGRDRDERVEQLLVFGFGFWPVWVNAAGSLPQPGTPQ